MARPAIAGAEQEKVARHQVARGEGLLMPVAQYADLLRRKASQGRHQSLGTTFLEGTDQGVDQYHDQDNCGVGSVTHTGRQRCRDEQNVDQRTLELAQEHPV